MTDSNIVGQGIYDFLTLNGAGIIFLGFLILISFFVREANNKTGTSVNRLFVNIVCIYLVLIITLFPLEGDQYVYNVLIKEIDGADFFNLFNGHYDILFAYYVKIIMLVTSSAFWVFLCTAVIYVFSYRYFCYKVIPSSAGFLFFTFISFVFVVGHKRIFFSSYLKSLGMLKSLFTLLPEYIHTSPSIL